MKEDECFLHKGKFNCGHIKCTNTWQLIKSMRTEQSKALKKLEEHGEMAKDVALEMQILNLSRVFDRKHNPEFVKHQVEDALWRCMRSGISISEKMERNRNLKSGSRFLDKFARQQAYGTCIGSGDDMFYVEQCYDYFKGQVKMWREFEKQVREDERKKVRR